MARLSLIADLIGEIDVKPRLVRLYCTDSYAQITALNYLSTVNDGGILIQSTDFIFASYGTTGNTKGVFIPTIASNGNVTLAPYAGQGNAISGSVVANHIAKFADTIGTLADGGVLGTAAAAALSSSQTTVAAVSGATVAGNLTKFSDTSGTVVDAGAKVFAGVTSTYAGGGTSNAFTVTGLTASSIVLAQIKTSTNSVSVTKAVPTTNTLTVTFSADPGATTVLNYIAFSAGLT